VKIIGELWSPHTASTDAKRRSMLRYRRIALTSITSLGSKAIALATAILIVPITYRYLGAERYGLWMTMTSFVLFLGFADAGIGNGLTAGIAAASGTDDHARIARLVSCAFYFLAPLSLLLLVGFSVASRFVNWRSTYGLIDSTYSHEAGTSTLILIACCLFSMPLGTVLRVQLGYQQGFLADLWTAAGSLLGIAGLFVAIHYRAGLPLLVTALAGAPVVVLSVNWLHQFFYQRPTLRPRLELFDWSIARQLFAVGGIFFLQQCFGLIYYTTDNIIIARTMGAVQVAHYALLQRIFSIGLIMQYVVMPLWPAIGEALARQDYSWAARAARNAILATVGISALCAALLLECSRFVALRWSGTDPGPIDSLRVGFAIWVVLAVYIATMNALLNHNEFIRQHVAIFGVASLASLVLKIIAAKHGSLANVIWSTDIGFATFYVIPTLFLTWRGFTTSRLGPNDEYHAHNTRSVPQVPCDPSCDSLG
jgi:O-antigen/teichoic acid export membrane protein